MKFKKALLTLLFTPILLTGCAISGSHLTLEDKTLVENDEQSTLSNRVQVYPLTPQTVANLRVNAPVSQANPALEQEVAQYEYQVGVGDILNITVWDHPELTIPAGAFRSAADAGNWVHADGTIFYPYIGRINVANKTVSEIRVDIAQRLAKYIESPQVDVNVAAFRSKRTYITGEVRSPGQQAITNIPMTLLDGINNAGGLSSEADWSNVSITRQGREELVSLHALMQRGDLTQNRLLQPGDIVHVPRNDAQKVFVMGEVNNPRLLKIDRAGMSLTEALSSVGGINQLAADATGVFVIRGTQNQEREERLADIYQLDIKDASALVTGTEFSLQAYDVVYVTAAPITRWNRVINLLLPTISGFNSITESVLRVRNWP